MRFQFSLRMELLSDPRGEGLLPRFIEKPRSFPAITCWVPLLLPDGRYLFRVFVRVWQRRRRRIENLEITDLDVIVANVALSRTRFALRKSRRRFRASQRHENPTATSLFSDAFFFLTTARFAIVAARRSHVIMIRWIFSSRARVFAFPCSREKRSRFHTSPDGRIFFYLQFRSYATKKV